MNRNLNINIGKDEYGKEIIINISDAKHLLMAGSTGSGKSTLLHKIITTLITNNSPEDLRLILIDPKRVELTLYNKIPHLLTEVIVDPKKAVLAMKWATKEIGRRFDIFKELDCKDISQYKGSESMPHILIVIDEFSDLIQTYPKETEEVVLKIAGIGHSVGVHIILSTSRPSTKVYTRAIQDAFISRVGLQVASATDSKLIIGTDSACTLRGSGDVLFRIGMKYIIRGQVDGVTEKEIKEIVNSLQKEYKENVEAVELVSISIFMLDDDIGSGSDSLYEEVKEAVIKAGKVSTSYIQRKFGIGYSRSAGLMDMLERRGIIGPSNGAKPRVVIKKK